jgi:hypothetical protein
MFSKWDHYFTLCDPALTVTVAKLILSLGPIFASCTLMDGELYCSKPLTNLQAKLIYFVAISVQTFPLSVLKMYIHVP